MPTSVSGKTNRCFSFSLILFRSIHFPRCKSVINSGFFWQTLVGRATTDHASREGRWQAALGRAGSGTTSDVRSRANRPGTPRQRPRAAAGRQRGRAWEPLPQCGSCAELLGACGPGFWFLPHGAEVSLKWLYLVKLEFTDIGFPPIFLWEKFPRIIPWPVLNECYL